MKKFYIFLLIFILATQAYANNKIPIKVIEILDGDTIKAKIDDNIFSVRLTGIDCYETLAIHRAYKQAYINKLSIDEVINGGLEAEKYLKHLYKNTSKAYFIFKGIDKYARALGIVYFDETNINKKLLTEGLCQAYKYRGK